MEIRAADSKRVLVRRIVAAAFLFFMLLEWGSHTMVHINSSTAGAVAVSAADEHGDDPCRSLVLCSDSRRRDQQVPNIGHDLIPTANLAAASIGITPIAAADGPPSPIHTASGLSRPPDPHFHPPQLA